MTTDANEPIDQTIARLTAERRRTERWLRLASLSLTAAVLLTLVWIWSAWAIDGVPYAEETITVSNTAIGVTSGLCTQSGVISPALIQVKSQAIYFTLNSATATPDSDDYEGPAGTLMEVQRPDRLRMIRQSSDAKVKVTCFQK
jgi:hypothetical protein